MPNIRQFFKDGFNNVWNCNKIADGESLLNSPTGRNEGITIKKGRKDKLVVRSNNLIRIFFNIGDDTSVTLKKALEALKMEWLPQYLDTSLASVRAGTKSLEDHNKYFNEQVKEIVKLSRIHHPDKQEQDVNTNAEQCLINSVTKVLRNIQDYVTNDLHENYVVYKLFEDAAITCLMDCDALRLPNILVKRELNSMAYLEGEILMRERNECLVTARHCLKMLNKFPKNWIDVIRVVNVFDKKCDNYKKLYKEQWVHNLKKLSKKCAEVKELEIVKPDIDMLLKESEEQSEILEHYELVGGKANKMFVQPILEYCALINTYYAFFEGVKNEKVSKCYKERNCIRDAVKQIIEKLSRQELLKSAQYTCNELIELSNKSLKHKKGKLANVEKELGILLFFKLERAAKLLGEEFVIKKTLVQRAEARIEAEREERRKKFEEIRERIKQDMQTRQIMTEQDTQKIRQLEQRAEQLEQTLQQINLQKVAIRTCAKKLAKLDHELQDAIDNESEDNIVEAAVSCTRGSLQQVIDAIIGEIKINRDQIIKERKVNAAVIELGIRNFSNQGTSLSDVNINNGESAGKG